MPLEENDANDRFEEFQELLGRIVEASKTGVLDEEEVIDLYLDIERALSFPIEGRIQIVLARVLLREVATECIGIVPFEEDDL